MKPIKVAQFDVYEEQIFRETNVLCLAYMPISLLLTPDS